MASTSNIFSTGIAGQIALRTNKLGLVFFDAVDLRTAKARPDGSIKLELHDGRHFFVDGTLEQLTDAIAEASRV